MKLALQIAAGLVLGYAGIQLLDQIRTAAALDALQHELATTHPKAAPDIAHAPSPIPRHYELTPPPVSNARWSVTTTTGKQYSGYGPPPNGGLSDAQPEPSHP